VARAVLDPHQLVSIPETIILLRSTRTPKCAPSLEARNESVTLPPPKRQNLTRVRQPEYPINKTPLISPLKYMLEVSTDQNLSGSVVILATSAAADASSSAPRLLSIVWLETRFEGGIGVFRGDALRSLICRSNSRIRILSI
jgi:hypothetical protein